MNKEKLQIQIRDIQYYSKYMQLICTVQGNNLHKTRGIAITKNIGGGDQARNKAYIILPGHQREKKEKEKKVYKK